MKHIWGKIKTMFAGGGREAGVAGGAGNQHSGALSPEERRRRIKRAAEYTVKEYGSVIERLAKE